ncbi:MAG: hypothetical protein JXX28_06780 [Deltaproteobacteria bacterium]|nr:hypothetical protein [Deltaproteobacteria bacterium]
MDAPLWYADADGDRYGDPLVTAKACAAPAGYVSDKTDCDDLTATTHPRAAESCNLVDDDCDTLVDEDVADAPTWYADSDNDGFGGTRFTVKACEAPAGYLSNSTDCDDLSAVSYPGAEERCDGKDNDCNTLVDDSPTDAATWYADADGDGFGDAFTSQAACAQPPGYVANALDACEGADAHRSVHVGATEVCDSLDNDCDGDVDGGAVDALTYYADTDGDRYGDPAAPTEACAQPAGTARNDDDCDDTTGLRAPGRVEVCDGLDNDCDTLVDVAALDASTWYMDTDGDGYGDTYDTTKACEDPDGGASGAGWKALSGDCDDDNPAAYPGAAEVCDGVDNNCNSVVDLDTPAPPTWYLDYDGDLYGNPRFTQTSCAQPGGYVSNDDDCDDDDPAISPAQDELCDGVDNDCDEVVDNPEDVLGEEAACAAISCDDAYQSLDSATNGVYWLDPQGDGVGAFEAWCDMSLSNGGWTLMGVFTNGDSSKHWTAFSDTWLTTTTLGIPADPSINADAKSAAWSQLPVDEVMIVSYPNTVWVQTNPGCLNDNTLQWAFRRNSVSSSTCAMSCSTTTVAGPWATGGTTPDRTDSTLRFRCMDTNGGSTTVGGYTVSGDDNSMLTTMVFTTYLDNNFGLGAGYGNASNTHAMDWDCDTADSGCNTDTTQVLLYGR